MLFSLLKSFCRRREGSVAVASAVIMPVIIGFLALGADYGHGLVIKTENQRTADLSAYAGALAYSTNSSTTAMTAGAQRLAALNGVKASQVTASLVTSPRSATGQAVSVNIATSDVLLLAPVLKSGTTMPVNAKSYAALTATAQSCMLALNSAGTGVTLSGGTSISAPACTVASNNTVSVPCGDTITAKSVTYNGAVPSQPCGGITAALSQVVTADPLASNAGVIAAAAHASSLSSLTSPSPPTGTSTNDISFAYSTSATQAQAVAAGCTAAFSGSTWTLTCPNGGTYYFRNITMGGGITVNFNTSGTAATTYNFSGSINNTGTAMNFGPGTYNIAQGIVNSGGATMSFGAGTFTIGGGSGSCGFYSICNNGTSLTFGGPSTFVLSSGISNNSTLTLGSGTTNSFNIGSTGSSGNALTVGGGSTTKFADATGTGDLFKMVGNFTSGGGSCVVLSAATAHDIDGSISAAGATVLGAGVYSIYGYLALGAGGGGDVSCNGSTVGFSGTNVTIAIAGTSTSSTSPCSGAAFCLAAGYSNVSLTAPTTGTNAYLAVIGPVSTSNSASALLTEGASNTSISGAVYFPYGPLTLTGGASIGNQTGQCLQIVASQIALSGGTSASASNCFSASSSSNTVQLVQ